MNSREREIARDKLIADMVEKIDLICEKLGISSEEEATEERSDDNDDTTAGSESL